MMSCPNIKCTHVPITFKSVSNDFLNNKVRETLDRYHNLLGTTACNVCFANYIAKFQRARARTHKHQSRTFAVKFCD